MGMVGCIPGGRTVLGERHRVHLLRALCQGEPPLSPGGWGEGVDGVRGRGRGRGRDRGRAGSGSDMSQFWDGGGGGFYFCSQRNLESRKSWELVS